MTRKIIIAILTCLFLAILTYSYFNFRQIKSPVTNALHAIPENAALIIKINNAQTLINKINDGNIIWAELINTEFFSERDKELLFIDSIIKNNPTIREIMETQSSYLSMHKSGAQKVDFLFSVTMPPYTDQKDIHKIIFNNAAGWNVTSRSFNGIPVVNIQKQSSSINYSIVKGILIFSPSAILIEESINQINSGKSIDDNLAFQSIQATAGTKVSANFFINYTNLSQALSTFLSENHPATLNPLSGFANWAAWDLNIKPNAILLNGFSSSQDSSNNYLNLFGKQKPQGIELTRILPSNTANFMFYGFSNFSSFHRDYKEYRKKEYPLNEQLIHEFITKNGPDSESDIVSWISNEIAVGMLETANKNIQSHAFAVISASNLENAHKQLGKFTQNNGNSIETYKDFEIFELPIGNAFELILGSAFSNLTTPYYTNIGRYIVLGNSPVVLKVFINEFLADRTLKKDNQYITFAENISTDANIYAYFNVARSIEPYQDHLKEDYSNVITKHKELFRKFEAVGFQVNSDGKFFYNNFYLKYNPVYKQQSVSLWETQLDSTVSSKPELLTNHLNNSKEIFVQDDGNTIYLISNTGKILWKKQLEEKIISSVHQIDLFKNEKLQLLFNTSSKLYLLDRNGNDIEKYPVQFKHKATSALTLLDYENSNDYRIFITQSDNSIYNYSGSGELVRGFVPVNTEMPVYAPIQHTIVNGKDYLIAVDKTGKVYIFDRKGETKIKLKEKLIISDIHNNLFLEKGKDLSKTYLVSTDSSGTIIKLNLSDELEKINIGEFSYPHFFDYKNITGDNMKEYIFINGNKLHVFNQNKENLFKHEFNNPLNLQSQYFYFPDGNGKTGVTDVLAQEIYLFDEAGNLFDNFPLKGSTLFSIEDINQDNNLNIVVGSGRNIYLYQIIP
ncbi:MAG: DUF3352 domain-containing protein [Bacteroidetes bacterium]|nr:DUF3352 domain-containing protein [Bacteroidota bacterium]HET6245754.1 DUF3352 domain-containing protein [Bacteroidia bacterium]